MQYYAEASVTEAINGRERERERDKERERLYTCSLEMKGISLARVLNL